MSMYCDCAPLSWMPERAGLCECAAEAARIEDNLEFLLSGAVDGMEDVEPAVLIGMALHTTLVPFTRAAPTRLVDRLRMVERNIGRLLYRLALLPPVAG